MVLTLPTVIGKRIKSASEAFGVEEKELFQNALAFYLEAIKPYLDLKQELGAWDKLSDEALLKFERLL